MTLSPVVRRPMVSFGGLLSCCLMLTVLSRGLSDARAQQPPIKIPPPVDFELKDKNGLPLAKDGVILKATYYPGLQKEKTVPIILLHGYKGSRSEYGDLAKYLQSQHGHAVLVPDLRGHGESIKVTNSNKPLDAAKLNANDFESMVETDVEACKKFLMEENNAGRVNIEKLCILGSEMGAVVAMNWAMVDWSWPRLVTGKQGQDVKAVILLSPLYTVEKGTLNMQKALSSQLQSNLAVCTLYGAEKAKPAVVRDATRIDKAMRPWHKDQSEDEQPILADVKTSLQGTKMLTVPELRVHEAIANFIKQRVVSKDHPWRERGGILN